MVELIIKNSNICEAKGPLKVLHKLYKEFRIKHPNAWHILMYQKGKVRWDGYIKYVSDTGNFRIGLLPMIYNKLESWGEKVKIIDRRPPLEVSPVIPSVLGDKELYPRQKKALETLLNNKVGKTPFYICAGDYSVGFGKCIGGESLIYTNRGVLRMDEAIDLNGNLRYKDLKVLAKDNQYHPILNSISNKIKAIRITTKNGYTQICGYDRHRYYTINKEGKLDWVLARELKIGDPLPIIKPLVTPNNNYFISPEEAYTMGVIHGDGHTIRNSATRVSIALSGKDYEILNILKPYLNSVCKNPINIKTHRKFNGWHISKSDRTLSRIIIGRYPELIGKAIDKIIPKFIMDSPADIQKWYIAGLFDTDGSKHKDVLEYSFSSVSKENIHRLHIMLLNLGIISFTSEKKTTCKDKSGITYRLRVGSREFEKFGRLIPLQIGRKKFNPSDIIKSRDNLFYQLPIVIGYKAKNHYLNQHYNTRNNPLDKLTRNQIRNPHRLTLESLYVLLKEAPDNELHNLYNFSKKVYWDKIKSIEVLEEYQCYDLEVKDVHEYIADGFICHNTMLFASIHQAFKRKIPTILLLNDSDLFKQFKREIPPLLPGEDIVFVQGGKINRWGNFNVAMVQSVSQNIKKYQYELTKIGIVLVDEADIIDNKTYKNVIEHLYNTQVRIGLSGTLYMSKLKKNLVHNMNIRSFIGDAIDSIKLADQIKSGKATPVVVKMVYVSGKSISADDYQEEYDKNITYNITAYEKSFSRMQYNARYGRFPMLIVTKFIDHCEKLYEYYQKRNQKLGLGYRIAHVHHKTPDRDKLLNDIREGKIDILISTTIISRGKNIPTLQYIQNTASMDSNEKTIQILGRLVRQHNSKKKAYLDDLVFPGIYLLRHGNHRKNYYKKENLKVISIGHPTGKQLPKNKRHRETLGKAK